ncbi:MAG: hypothetical protein L3J25_00280 [Flavobacteriaceae bacterium]|nr:hypothetical protein [Flavobacteriaceae bacterium]
MTLPFKFGKVIEASFFINRTEEIAFLKQNILSSINVTVISPRRWGKSSLIIKTTNLLAKQHKHLRFCYIDLFNIRNEAEFYNVFASEVLKVSYSKWEERLKSIKTLFKQIIPKLSIGVDSNSDISISFNVEDVQKNPSEILNLPETISKAKNIQIVVCLDEFQNIGHFDNPLEFQKKLRAHWQHHQTASYIIYGSKQHMMMDVFENKSMPFYKFGEVLFLSKILNIQWQKYIVKKFKATDKVIDKKLASQLANLVDNHSYFVQQFANTVWLNTKLNCTEKIIDDSLVQLFNQYEMLFIKELDNLSNPQVNFLKAVCNNEKALSGKKTIAKYNLGTSGSVVKIRKALIDKEVIDNHNKTIEFMDPLFKLWFKNRYMQ